MPFCESSATQTEVIFRGQATNVTASLGQSFKFHTARVLVLEGKKGTSKWVLEKGETWVKVNVIFQGNYQGVIIQKAFGQLRNFDPFFAFLRIMGGG